MSKDKIKKSCGILIYRSINDKISVLLCKFGGVFWKNKFMSSWTFPKGEMEEGESDLECALREFYEETSLDITFDNDRFIDLGEVETPNKINHIFAYEHSFCESDENMVMVQSNTFTDVNNVETPEVCEKAYYFDIDAAVKPLINPLVPFLDRLKNVIYSNLNMDTDKDKNIIVDDSSKKNAIKNTFEKYCKSVKASKNVITEPENEDGEAIGGDIGGGMVDAGGAVDAGSIGGDMPSIEPMPAPAPMPQPPPPPPASHMNPWMGMYHPMRLPYGAFMRYTIKQDPAKKKSKKRKKKNSKK